MLHAKLATLKESKSRIKWIGDGSRRMLKLSESQYVPLNIRSSDSEWMRIYTAPGFSVQLPHNSKYNGRYLRTIETLVYLIRNLIGVNNTWPKRIDIIMPLIDTPKVFPKEKGVILGPNEVNSGMTEFFGDGTRSVWVLRKQEWIKVLAHELLHAHDVDRISMSAEALADLKFQNRYAIEKHDSTVGLRLSEAYVDVIACKLQAYIKGYRSVKDLTQYMRSETDMIVRMAVAVNNHHGGKHVQGSTHTFSYFWCKAALMKSNETIFQDGLRIRDFEKYCLVLMRALDAFDPPMKNAGKFKYIRMSL